MTQIIFDFYTLTEQQPPEETPLLVIQSNLDGRGISKIRVAFYRDKQFWFNGNGLGCEGVTMFAEFPPPQDDEFYLGKVEVER